MDMSETPKAALQDHQSGRFDDAEAGYRRVLDAEPRNADALYLLGVLNLQLGNTDLTLDLTARAIDISPAQVDYHNIRGEAYRLRRDYQAAIECYEEAIPLRPGIAGAYLNLGNALKEIGRLE